MVYKIADNILSPLGETTEQNYQAVKAGRSALCRYSDHWQLPEPFSASLFSEAQWQALAAEGLTPFEALATSSVRRALKDAAVIVGDMYDLEHPHYDTSVMMTYDEDPLLFLPRIL